MKQGLVLEGRDIKLEFATEIDDANKKTDMFPRNENWPRQTPDDKNSDDESNKEDRHRNKRHRHSYRNKGDNGRVNYGSDIRDRYSVVGRFNRNDSIMHRPQRIYPGELNYGFGNDLDRPGVIPDRRHRLGYMDRIGERPRRYDELLLNRGQLIYGN